MARICLALLGSVQARMAAGPPVPLPARKAQALLAYLALHPGQAQPRDKLATLLWGDASHERARHSLRQALVALRRALPKTDPRTLLEEGQTVALTSSTVEVDVTAFERLVADGAPEALEGALALYQGDLLEGLEAQDAPFEEWLAAERERLRELALEALARLVGHYSSAGAIERAVQAAVRLLALDPLQEPAHRTLMRLYARQGRRGAALRQFQTCLAVLQRELGVEPEPETRRVYREVLRQRLDSAELAESRVAPVRRARRRPARRGSEAASLEPLVGRRAELARLSQALNAACAGTGTTAVVLGEAGLGKTRLVDELSATALQQGCRVVVGRCYESEQILPFGPWVETLRAAIGGAQRSALESLDPVSRSELGRLLPELADPGSRSADPQDDYLRLFAAVAQVIRVVAEPQPLVLILEDLHWGDEMTVRLFGFLAHRVEAWPALLVATAREEELGDALLLRRLLEELRERSNVVSLTLSPLSAAETRVLVQALVRAGTGQATLGRIAGQVWALSEGNPFVVVEAMRALQEGHGLGDSTIALPARVRQVIGDRLDRLSAHARELVAVAAVIGREFEFALLQRAAGLGEEEEAEGLEELVRRRLLHVVGERIDFTHERIREVAYARLLPPRRKQLHAAVGGALEALYVDDLEPHHAALGMHYRNGQVWEKAVGYLRQAGARSVTCSANRDAVGYFEQALDALEHLPDSPRKSEQAFDLRIYLQASSWALGELVRIVDHLGEAETLARALNDKRRVGRVCAFMSSCLAVIGERARAVEEARRAYAIAEELHDFPLLIGSRFFLGYAAIARGEFPNAVELLERNAAELEGELRWKRLGQICLPSVSALAWLTVPLAELGAFPKAIARGQEVVAIAEASEQPYSLALACWALGNVYCIKHEPGVAVSILERSLALCRDHELVVLSPLATSSLGYAYALSGRLGEALPLLEQAVQRAESLSLLWGQPRRLTQLGEGYLRAGRPNQAMEAAERAVALADQQQERANRAHAFRLLGELAFRRVPPDSASAEQHLFRALATAEELGMRPLIARCRLDLGQMYAGAGDQATAEEHLSMADALLREMEMRRGVSRSGMDLNER